ncbi:MAG TPA: class I SAM-dependent methyltransferase, partial [Longimicrobiaceae bacterium]
MADEVVARGYRGEIYASYVSDGASSHFTHTPDEYAAQAAALRARVGEWLPADRSAPVLDIGCGSGYFLHLLDELGYTDVTGVDVSPEQVEIARKNCPRATVLLGDARELLKANPGRFQLITGFDFVEHFGKDELFPLLDVVVAALR